MKTNMGMIDRMIRIVIAIVIIALYYTNVISGVLAIVLLVFSGIFLLTSFVGVCPLYLPFGFSTQKK